MPLAESAVLLANSALRVSSSVLEQAAALPPEAFERMARALSEDLEAGELGRALAALVSIHRRMAAADPGLHARLRAEITDSLGPDLGRAFSPAALAGRTNRAAAAFNRRAAADPGWVAEGLDDFLGALDTQEIGRMAASVRARAAEAAARHPEVIKALIGALLSALYGSARGYLRSRRFRWRKAGGVNGMKRSLILGREQELYNEYVRAWKEGGGKVLGYSCLITAGGADRGGGPAALPHQGAGQLEHGDGRRGDVQLQLLLLPGLPAAGPGRVLRFPGRRGRDQRLRPHAGHVRELAAPGGAVLLLLPESPPLRTGTMRWSIFREAWSC